MIRGLLFGVATLLAASAATAAQEDTVDLARQALVEDEEGRALAVLAPVLAECERRADLRCATARQLEIGAMLRQRRVEDALKAAETYARDFGEADEATGLLYATVGANFLITEDVARAEPLLLKGFEILDAANFDIDAPRWEDGFLGLPRRYLGDLFEGVAMILATAMYDRGLYPEAERYLRLGVLGSGFGDSYGDDGTALVIAHLMRLQERCTEALDILDQLAVSGAVQVLLLREQALCLVPRDSVMALARADKAVATATALAGQSSSDLWMAEAKLARGAALLASARYGEAATDLADAARLRGDLPARIGEEGRITPVSNPAMILRLLAAAQEGAGRTDKALATLHQARDAAVRFGGPSLEDRIEGDAAMARFLLRQGQDLVRARALLGRASDLLDERLLRFSSFDTAAQSTARRFRTIRTAQIAAAWALSH